MPRQDASDRRHLVSLFEKLRRGMSEDLVHGVRTDAQARDLVRAVSFPEHPVLEKLCILHIFQRWFRSANVADAAGFIREQALAKLSGTKDKKFDEFVDKHKSDMIAQLLRENAHKQVYAGLDSFIAMSEGLPRALITILKHVYDWATYTGEDPFRLGKISVSSQHRGVTEAADLFLEQMLPDGEDGVRVGSAIERLCTLFRANRFADKPVETSLIAFSVDQLALAAEARDLLELATKTSLIIAIEGGQRERNSMSVTNKYEINRMLSPRRDLPIARRGIVSFDPKTVNSIFIEGKQSEFEAFARSSGGENDRAGFWSYSEPEEKTVGRRAGPFRMTGKEYNIFYKTELSTTEPWSAYKWDIFASAFNSSERVQLVFDRVAASRKLWLIHSEYGYERHELPQGLIVELNTDEAHSIKNFVAAAETAAGKSLENISLCVDLTGFMRPHLLFLALYLHFRNVRRFDII